VTGATKKWSGRRESNPRMQLGKLDVSQRTPRDSCKTGRKSPYRHQWVTAGLQNSTRAVTVCKSSYGVLKCRPERHRLSTTRMSVVWISEPLLDLCISDDPDECAAAAEFLAGKPDWPKRATSGLKRGHSCFSRPLGALPRTLTIGPLCRIADGIGNSLDISPKTSRLRRPCPLPPIRDNAPLSCVAWRRAWCASSGRENRVAQWNTL
jgi:hypothetical protein